MSPLGTALSPGMWRSDPRALRDRGGGRVPGIPVRAVAGGDAPSEGTTGTAVPCLAVQVAVSNG